MDMWYWVMEYGKVFCGYLFLMFLWPLTVFHGHLRTKSKSYCFTFCVTATIVIINTIILTMGLFHVLDQKAVFALFYGVFAVAFFKNILTYFVRKYTRTIETRTFVFRVLLIIILAYRACIIYLKKVKRCLNFESIRKWISHGVLKIGQGIKENIRRVGRSIILLLWKYGILMLLLAFGIMYFSYGSFQIHSYGAGDLYTHHRWIYSLIEGNIFPDGIYPEAMHCFIYCMSTLFRINVQSVLMYLQGIHVVVFLLSIYLLLGNIFHCRYTPIFVLTLFLALDLRNSVLIFCMYRLQITLPQEFGLYTACLSAFCLMNYLNDTNAKVDQKRRFGFQWNENLILFMFSVAASVTIHFFVVIMAFFLCFSVCLFALRKVFCKRRLISLIASILCALLVSSAPMALALLQGIPFSGSVNWAVSTMTEKDDESLDVQEKVEVNEILHRIYEGGYVDLYGKKRTACFFVIIVISVLCCILTKWKYKHLQNICRGYPIIMFIANLYVITYAAPLIGLPDIIPEGRFGAIGHMMFLAVMVIPIDVLFGGLMSICSELKLWLLSIFMTIGIYEGVKIAGCFRGYLFYELSRYNSVAEVTNLITERFPEYSYTIVSPTDELYLVIQCGWHEELLTFVEKCNSEEYTIPSEYVFIYVEKKPILYAQRYFFDGPSWMGQKKYPAIMSLYNGKIVSQAPEIISSHVSQEAAQQDIPEYSRPWLMYLQNDNRTILESKVYDWCQRFKTAYPEVLNVFYEDDDFVCYYFRQDADKPLYNLSIIKE